MSGYVQRSCGSEFPISSTVARRPDFVYQVMTIGLATPEGGAIPGAQHLFAVAGDQRKFAIQYPDELILMGMPMTLAGPCTWLDDGQVHAEKCHPRMACQPLAGLTAARGVKWMRITATSLRRYG